MNAQQQQWNVTTHNFTNDVVAPTAAYWLPSRSPPDVR